LPIGEDTIYICENCGTAHNKEIVPEDGFKCIKCGGTKARVERASEVGNIFPLETKYSKPFDLKVLDENGKEKDVIMGCYGIGVSRLMGVIAEYFTKDGKIIWPESIAPADYYIIVLGEHNLPKAEEFAKKLESEGKEVILDDRQGKKYGFGVKIKDAELI
jgi:prolyl-tRNA synthetase